MPQPDGRQIILRRLVRILPWCMIAAVVLASAYGLVHIYKLSITDDMDKKDGDLYPLLKTGPDRIQRRIHELRPKLWRNEGRKHASAAQPFRRASDVLWNLERVANPLAHARGYNPVT